MALIHRQPASPSSPLEEENPLSAEFAIVTDSTADIPPHLAQDRQIFVAPMHIYWDGEDLRDGIDIAPSAFYERLVKSRVSPTTSQPTLPEFRDIFQRAVRESGAKAVIVLTISAQLSGTYNAACQAAKLMDFPVYPIDTRTGSLAHGLTALSLADARDAGISVRDAVEFAQQLAAKTKMVFALNTLEFLYRSGRVNNLQRLLGTALRIKPILHVQNGGISLMEQVRSRRRQIKRLLELFEETVDSSRPLQLGILHGNALDDMQSFLDSITKNWQPIRIVQNTVCAPVGVHTGPGSLGFAILQQPIEL
jgi:DegV family protein with EDD domain